MIVVSDTSPIINLAAVGQLDLLRQLYGQLLLPQAVYDESVIAGQGDPGSSEVQAASWIETRTVANRTAVVAFLDALVSHAGSWIDGQLYGDVPRAAGE